jgi:hypothetical protein
MGVLVGMIHAGLAVLTSPISIQPESRVITIGAVSEFLRAALAKFWFISIEVVVELFMAVSFITVVGFGSNFSLLLVRIS